MRTKGDELRRYSCYTAHGVKNTRAARAMTKNYAALAHLMKDDLTRETFQVTYLRITERYHGGDFVKQFTRLFNATLKELTISEARYSLRKREVNGIYQKDEED